MKRIYKYLFVFLGSLFIFPLVSSAECSYERQAELSKIAANVKFSYTYDVSNSEPIFMVDISNVTNDIYVEDGYGEILTKNASKVYTHGQTIDFSIRSKDNNCYGEKIINQYVTLPNFNVFSTYPECSTHPEFKYCQAWMNEGTNLSKDDFDAELDKYTKTTKVSPSTETNDKFDMIKQFVQTNQTILIISLIATIILLIVICIKKRR